jgi:hypothetical protein
LVNGDISRWLALHSHSAKSPKYGDISRWLSPPCGYGGFETLAELIHREGVGRVCTDHSADTLQRMAVELANEIASGKNVSARCCALSAKLFSPETAVKQSVAALDRQSACI